MKFDLPIPFNSKFATNWNFFIFLLSIYASIVIPVNILFELNPSSFLYISLILVSFIFMLDILFHFNVAYMVRMKFINDKKQIIKNYLKSWFTVDLLASIPYELIFIFDPSLLHHPFIYLFSALRIAKITRASRTIIRTTKIKPTLYRLLFLILFVLQFTHFVSCLWILISTNIPKETENFVSIMYNHYLQGFYWTITTITTIGYGDITPDKTNNLQLLFVICLQLVGAGMYGFIIGNIANLISKFDIAKANHNEKTDSINEFLKYHNIPPVLSMKINDYYQYLWETRHGYNENEVMENLPHSLKLAVSIQINKEMIEKVPFFKEAQESLIEEIISNLEPQIATPNDLIVRAGDMGNEMYFIKKGSISVLSADGEQKYAELHQGSFFGEVALIEETKRNANIVANDYCDLYILKKDAFDKILESFPIFKEQIQNFAKERKQAQK